MSLESSTTTSSSSPSSATPTEKEIIESSSLIQQCVSKFDRKKHINYFLGHIKCMPAPYQGQDQNRMTLLYFAVSGLDVLGALDEALTPKLKQEIVSWVYSMLVINKKYPGRSGFIGGGYVGRTHYAGKQEPEEEVKLWEENESYAGHVAMTYTALAVLTILGEDVSKTLSEEQKSHVLQGIEALQDKKTGCFSATYLGSEQDVRFMFAASVSCAYLQKWSYYCEKENTMKQAIDKVKALHFIRQARSYDTAYAHDYGLEGHGGSTYCAISAMNLMLNYDKDLEPEVRSKVEAQWNDRKWELLQYLLRKQISGWTGRPCKDPDTCYSFWVGAGIHQLVYDNTNLVAPTQTGFMNPVESISFTMTCQNEKIGGFSKVPGVRPDILHSYMALCGLSFCGFPGLNKIVPELGITERAASILK